MNHNEEESFGKHENSNFISHHCVQAGRLFQSGLKNQQPACDSFAQQCNMHEAQLQAFPRLSFQNIKDGSWPEGISFFLWITYPRGCLKNE